MNNLDRYIALTQPGLDKPVLSLDSEASLQDLHAFVDLRVSLATRCLDALAGLKPTSTEEQDLSAIAGTAHVLMQEACDANRLIEKRLWVGATL